MILVLAIFSLYTSFLSAGIHLQVKGGLHGREEETGTPVMVVCQGDDYVMQVTRDDGDLGDVVVNGVQDSPHFEVTRGGTSNSMIMENGRTKNTITHTYYLRPVTTGSYNLGPAVVEDNGRRVTSNTIDVRVVEPAAYDQFAGKRGAARQALACSIDVDVHEVYVGQPVTLTVTMEDDGQVMERGLQPPVFGKLQAQPIGKATSAQKVVNGQVKIVTKQDYAVSADSAGTYTVGPATAHFVVPDQDQANLMGGFFGSFFGQGGKKRTVRSNSTIIAVKPLPLSTEPVDGVGRFESIAVRAHKQVVELNEPITVTFSVIGNGNFDAIVAPTLQLPETMEVYPSTSSCVFDPAVPNKGTKSFEYIMQIGEQGVHEIPAQRFTYFDTIKGSYCTLLSEPVSIQVKKAKVVAGGQNTSVEKSAAQEKHPEVTKVYDGVSLPVIPWWWLVYLACFIACVLLKDMFYRWVLVCAEWAGITSEQKRQRAYLTRLIAEQEVGQVYSFFITLLVAEWRCDPQEIDAEYVKQRTHEWGWDFERSEGFASYIDRCSQAAFASQTMKESVKTELLDKTLYWYELVNGQLRRK
ncbi:MAG: hypothetical protein QG604_734 [Candidatus Dependentiae bacterium]|nr:hypothetical protein [Candidatus Dependentiae bacterium]